MRIQKASQPRNTVSSERIFESPEALSDLDEVDNSCRQVIVGEVLVYDGLTSLL
jgi:hypothetical protein